MSEDSSSRVVAITTFNGSTASRRDDAVAEEEPLEIQVNGVACAVVMRTPGHDEELALGFLLTERVISRFEDVLSMRHCSTAREPEADENLLRVVLREDVDPQLERLRRNTFASASCGICGKATIDAAVQLGGRVESDLRVSPTVLFELPSRLRAAQAGFAKTGGLHAAALFDAHGEIVTLREDVGRHNAVDKVVGYALREGIDRGALILFVSGRISFEVVQKAAHASIPMVAGISAPTSLAVRAGDALGISVVGFVRGTTMNVYAHAERFAESAGAG